jgi:hypothetical protein
MRAPWIAGLLLLAACGKDITKDIEAFSERVCACKDKACANKALDDFIAFAEKNKESRGDEDRAKAATEKLMACAMKLDADVIGFAHKLEKVTD